MRSQAELSRHDASAELPTTCVIERYVSSSVKTWYVRGDFGEFLGYFEESLVL